MEGKKKEQTVKKGGREKKGGVEMMIPGLLLRTRREGEGWRKGEEICTNRTAKDSEERMESTNKERVDGER